MVKIKQYDPRPSRANPEARATRKKLEKESPHISMSEVAMKGGALALLTAVALFPWEKEYDKHERTHHPERFEDPNDYKNKNRAEDGKRSGDGREDRGRRDGDEEEERRDRRRRRQSEGGEREREYRKFLNRDREYRPLPAGAIEVAPSSVGSGVERYTGSEDGEYGRKYIEATREERAHRYRRDEDEYGRRRRGSVDYEYRRSSRDERRR